MVRPRRPNDEIRRALADARDFMDMLGFVRARSDDEGDMEMIEVDPATSAALDAWFVNEWIPLEPTHTIFDDAVTASMDRFVALQTPASQAYVASLGDKTLAVALADPCAICLECPAAGDAVVELRCGHHLHKECSSRWLAVADTCPVCRHPCTVTAEK